MTSRFRLMRFSNSIIKKHLMYSILKISVIVCLLMSNSLLFAQEPGSISGIITDKSTNETLIGANILILGTTQGASTDIDGYYSIKGLAEGKYDIRISFISYQTVVVEKVEVKTGEDTKINVSLEPASTELDEVVVTAELIQSTESAVLTIQKNSLSIVDGISAELISKNNSSDGTDVLKRMTGVTISDGKYAFVRGVGDRYNNTQLNGANLPSTDPEKRSFSYDLFPASLIENIITSKTFSPDKPADFTGGLVQISTIEFPSKFIFDISTSASYNTNTTGESFLTYSGGRTDFLGYDDGTRDLPGIINGTKVAAGNYSPSALSEITKSFSNNWTTHSIKAPVNGSFKINIGNRYEIDESVFGFIGSLTYSNSMETRGIEKALYDQSGSRYEYKGNNYSSSVIWGGLLNLSYKFGGTSKISFKNVYNQNAEDVTTLYAGDYRYADQYREYTSLSYISRSLLSNQAIGEHSIDLLNGVNIDWNLSYSQSKRDEPDGRRYVYYRQFGDPETEPLRFHLDQSLATRYYGKLSDHNYSGNVDFTIKLFDEPDLPKIKVGYLHDQKDRDFDARSIGFRNGTANNNFLLEDSVLQLSVDQIFRPENINPSFIIANETTKPSDSYTAKQFVDAAYFMTDALLFNKLKIMLGARYEHSNQKLNTIDNANIINLDANYNDILPGVSLTYIVNEWINVRAAYSITLARPEFRELAPFVYYDFIESELVKGNHELKRTLINNYDIRAELYPGAGELLAVSFFYKRFIDPIEEIVQSVQSELQRSFENAGMAKNYGIEIEFRKNLGFIASSLQNLNFIANGSLIDSKVILHNNEIEEGERALQGQAPYIFNLGLYYDDFEDGLNASLIYNKVGERISSVGSVQLGNVMERPVDLIDFSISNTFFNYLTLKLTLKDILNQDKLFIQKSPLGDKVFELERAGRNISLGLSYKL